jgi:hypothetical protein
MNTAKLQTILDSYDENGVEVREVPRVGKKIRKLLAKTWWVRWTYFPRAFSSCRSEAELLQTVDNLNRWLKEAMAETIPVQLVSPGKYRGSEILSEDETGTLLGMPEKIGDNSEPEEEDGR